jgi:hypothetical protein
LSNNQDEKEIDLLSKLGRRANTGLVLGIIALIAWLVSPDLCLVLSVLGIIFSSIGLPSYLKGKAITGLVLSILGFFLSLFMIIGLEISGK